jgi:hypothetical protein
VKTHSAPEGRETVYVKQRGDCSKSIMNDASRLFLIKWPSLYFVISQVCPGSGVMSFKQEGPRDYKVKLETRTTFAVLFKSLKNYHLETFVILLRVFDKSAVTDAVVLHRPQALKEIIDWFDKKLATGSRPDTASGRLPMWESPVSVILRPKKLSESVRQPQFVVDVRLGANSLLLQLQAATEC